MAAQAPQAKKKILQEFREFLNQGDFVTIAVGLIIALYFQQIINAILAGASTWSVGRVDVGVRARRPGSRRPAPGARRGPARDRGRRTPRRRGRTPADGPGPGLRPRSSAIGRHDDRPALVAIGASRSERMTSTETSGWSPSATRTALASGPIASNPTASELDSPRSGSGFTTRRSARQSIAASTRRGVAPEHDDDLLDPGLGEGVEDVLEDRPAADRREQLAAPEARPGARRQDEPDRRHPDPHRQPSRSRRALDRGLRPAPAPARASARRSRRSARRRSRRGSPGPSRPAPGRQGRARPARAAGRAPPR